MKIKFVSIFIILLITNNLWATEPREISLEEALYLAEINSPLLSAAKLRELAAEKNIDLAKANYFPTVNLESIYSMGFPGSSGLTGIGGLIGSPYRSEVGAGVVATQIIWDFGRTSHAVRASKFEAELSEQDTQVKLYEVKNLALQKFFECSLYKTQSDLWEYLEKESTAITKQVERFVNTGQRSIVDRYLSEAQTEQATSTKEFFAELLTQSVNELSIIMGVSNKNFSCPILPRQTPIFSGSAGGVESSPLFTRTIVSEKVAQEKLKQEKAGYYPEIKAVASAGYLQKARLVQKKDYAVGIGIIQPIFDLSVRAKVKRAQAIAAAKKKDIEAEKQYLQEIDAKFDETIKASQLLLGRLDTELKIANDAFGLAQSRYFDLEGELVDVREAFRNLMRVKVDIANTRARLLQASGAKYLLNGG